MLWGQPEGGPGLLWGRGSQASSAPGNPSLEKCRALKEEREEAAEVASLDVANIISGSGEGLFLCPGEEKVVLSQTTNWSLPPGRPRRRTAWNPSGEAALSGELYCRTLDSEEERPRQAPPDWSHMRGIISSDCESN